MSPQDKLSERIERMYAAVGATIDDRFTPVMEEDKDDPRLIHIDLIGPPSDAHDANLAYSAVYAVGNFWDHCRHFASKSGIDIALVDSVTANSLDLRIVRDLYNADKHPGSTPNTSGVSPTLKDLRRWVDVPPGPGIGISFNADGTFGVNIPQGCTTSVDAEVINSKTGKSLGRLEQILGRGVDAWETFLKKIGALID